MFHLILVEGLARAGDFILVFDGGVMQLAPGHTAHQWG